MKDYEIRAFHKPWKDGIGFYVIRTTYEGHIIRSMMTDMVFTDLDEGCVYPDTPLELDMGKSQELMNMLWECGLRPAQGHGSTGQLKATENHLEDMRKLSNKLLDAVIPPRYEVTAGCARRVEDA